jgi:hypothetical protein
VDLHPYGAESVKLLKLNALCAGLFFLVLAILMAKPATAATRYEHATCTHLECTGLSNRCDAYAIG